MVEVDNAMSQLDPDIHDNVSVNHPALGKNKLGGICTLFIQLYNLYTITCVQWRASIFPVSCKPILPNARRREIDVPMTDMACKAPKHLDIHDINAARGMIWTMGAPWGVRQLCFSAVTSRPTPGYIYLYTAHANGAVRA